MPRSSGWLALLVVALFALPMAAGSLWSLGSAAWLQLTASRLPGTVVERSEHRPTQLVVEWVAADGEPHRVTSAGSDLYDDIAHGDTVFVLVDPAHPADARLDLFVELWLVPLVLAAFSAVFCGALAFMYSQVRPGR